MSDLLHLSPKHLRQAAKLKERIEGLNKELANIFGSTTTAPDFHVVHEGTSKRKGGMSAAGRARIAAAQKLRWKKFNASNTTEKPASEVKGAKSSAKKKRGMSAATKAKMAAAAKARWAKIKVAGKNEV